ncbi:MAG: hypothetical protein HN509_15510 [Halobacteriovoraceae bacterium]|jgi:hypothetical protein|nr:hypothetical protein [Halobacteriovoraceae bacterium]MBT5092969.1 hypothetical protein [Halobacteriovoraceae bacterium]
MKKSLIILLSSLILAPGLALAKPVHMPLELTFEESLSWNKNLLESTNKDATEQIPETKESIRAGERMNKWLKMINAARPADQQIRLTNSANRGNGIPIDRPSKYGPSTIIERLNKLKSELPEALKKVMIGNAEITAELPVSTEEFIKWAKVVSRLYQTAVRWTGMSRWLPWLAQNKKRDVRGFFYLKKVEDLDAQLKVFGTLTTEVQSNYKNWLSGVCQNSGKKPKACLRELETAIEAKLVFDYKKNYWDKAQAAWNSFFEISKPRRDVTWTSEQPGVMNVTFKDPKNERIADWLKINIEEEFKRPLLDWRLQFNFVEGGMGTAFLKFEAGVTPHVTAGNIIVMDANSPIEEWSVRWTIRHEYGHILRIPDCYVEFYDTEVKLMVNYQLDVTDLMCSRSGDMNDRLYHELKKNYFKN